MTNPAAVAQPLRAAIYCRISSDREATQLGVKRQEKDCRALIEAEGWTVQDLYIDNDISAADPGKHRSAYERLIRAIRAHQVDAVVVAVEDRLHRQPSELEDFVAVCNRAAMKLIASPRGGVTKLDDPDPLMLLRIKGAMAAREVDVLRKRVQRKHLELAEQGKHHGGPRPYGWESDGVTPREDEAANIREAAERVLNGQALRAIRDDWNRRGIPTVHGRGWQITTIRDILRTPRNAGWRQHLDRTNLVDAEWPAIVDRDTWTRVQAVLDNPSRKPRPVRRDYILRGLLRCSLCGHYLNGAPQGRPTLAEPDRIVRYYRCRKDDGGCSHTFVKAEYAEAAVIPAVLALVDHPAVRAISDSEAEAEHQRIRTLVAENADDNKRLAELEDAFAQGDLTRAGLQRNGRLIRERMEGRNAELADLEGQTALSRYPGGIAEHWDDLDMDDRRAILKTLVEYVDVKPGGGRKSFDPGRFDIRWRLEAVGNLALDLRQAGDLEPAVKAWLVAAQEAERRTTPDQKEQQRQQAERIRAEYLRRLRAQLEAEKTGA